MSAKTPPVPPHNKSPQDTGRKPNAKPEPMKSKDTDVDQVGDRANIKQNTSNVQDKR